MKDGGGLYCRTIALKVQHITGRLLEDIEVH